MRRAIPLMALVALVAACAPGAAPGQAARVEQVTPHVAIVSSPRGNLVVRTGAQEALVVGPQYPELTQRARQLLTDRHVAAPRWVIATAAPDAARFGAGGWGEPASAVAAQEHWRARIRRAAQGAHNERLVPDVGFSRVLQLAVDGTEVHAVHQPSGYSDADISVHLEGDDVVLLGESYAGDGYPRIDTTAGGRLDGIIKSLAFFTQFGPETHFVPARGPVRDTRALSDYVAMLRTVRDRVSALQRSGASPAAVLAAHPTASLDAAWGHGAVSPAEFVRSVDASLRAPPDTTTP